jgi:hypothetical protein
MARKGPRHLQSCGQHCVIAYGSSQMHENGFEHGNLLADDITCKKLLAAAHPRALIHISGKRK